MHKKTVSGTVSDENGLPLSGASVIVQGTTSGVSTDFDGKYSIKANTGDVLQFSYVGYSTQNQTVGTSNSINVSLQPDNALEEVVVMGYATQNKAELTGSTVQVDADEIEMVPVASVDQVLQGKVAGLQINQNPGY